MNYKIDAATAEELNKTFLEIVMALNLMKKLLKF
jgi:AICAR transformylase/IMP cyclohydrolase PurH